MNILEWIDQTGNKQAWKFDYVKDWLIAIENRLRLRHWPWLVEQDKISFSARTNCWFQEHSKNRTHGWSAAQHKIGWQPLQVDFKPPKLNQESLYFYFLNCLIDSCVNVNQESLDYTHIKEWFSWKRLRTLSQK